MQNKENNVGTESPCPIRPFQQETPEAIKKSNFRWNTSWRGKKYNVILKKGGKTMLLEWYNNGLAQAYIIFGEIKSGNLLKNINVKEEFEKLINNKKEFEKFLDENREVPLSNVKFINKKGGCEIKNIKLASTTRPFSKSGEFNWNGIFKIEDKKSKCSICSSQGTRSNMALIFPFERKAGLNFYTYFDEKGGRLKLCTLCQKICFYSFGNIFYNNSDDRVTIFFPSSDDYEKIVILTNKLKQIRISNIERDSFRNIKPEGIVTYYPFEFLYPCLFTFYNYLEDKKERIDANILSDIKIELISYLTGNLPIYDTRDSITRIDKIFMMFETLDRNIKKINEERKIKGQEPLKITSIFNMFFNSLTIDRKTLEDKNKLREQWVKILLVKNKVDYIILNEIVMERIKSKNIVDKNKFINFYKLIIKSIWEGLNMEEEKNLFEKVNSIGWHLVNDNLKSKKEDGFTEDQMKSFLWDVFRTRTYEDLLSAIVEIQLKCKTNLDLRIVDENKQRWREIKAIFLNGMANALFSPKPKEGGEK